MALTTNRTLPASLPRPRVAAAVHRVRPPTVPGLLRRGALVTADLLRAMGIVLCIPFIILAIGMPIALCVRFLLWITGML